MGIVVLGMHRSGTSVLARFLGVMVGYQGHAGAAPDNEEGHWELPQMNYELEVALRNQGADWASPPLGGMILPTGGPGSLGSLQKIIDGMGSAEWVLKDPRFCLCLEEVVELCEGSTFVVTYRSPLEVARSIEVRDSYVFEYGLALWEVYNRLLLQSLRHVKERVIWIPYHDLMTEPRSTGIRVGEQLRSFGHTVRSSGHDMAASTINSSLRHHRSQKDDSRMSDEQRALLASLNMAASSGGSINCDVGDLTPWARALIETRRPYAKMERDNRLLRKRARPLVPAYRSLDRIRRGLNMPVPEDPFGFPRA